MAVNSFAMEKSFDSIHDQIGNAKVAFEAIDYDDETDLTEDVATPALLALSELVALMRDLREAGADIAEIPAEDEALVLVIANGALIQKHIEDEVAHLEGVMERFK